MKNVQVPNRKAIELPDYLPDQQQLNILDEGGVQPQLQLVKQQ